MTVLDSDARAADYLREVEEGTKVVEEVDLLPNKHNGKVLHMYVTLASVALAGCAASRLDGYKLNGKALRCNFASDKSQRAEAIRLRNK
ncbi:hypothetical protein STCU_02571 [Strigomonas culicis]|uniref:Uncharacterized protein n=1 Tax=Strigomonas culicis TaxID=28005 RepID=S9W254_9TRYP|nr:hypothetical protein STCU_04333 [Strigomonas culicis]EPY32930.1 hypothetical protein STCU_02571 [Strigomonas culicis]|eukprot:EPY29905.1 hypothetical protein STCU_04333 [Strigomonas culicis]